MKKKIWYTLAVPDPDLEIRGWVGGGVGGGAVFEKFFSALRASVWSENKRGEGEGEPGPWAPPLDPPLLKYFSIYSFISLIGPDHN